MELKDVIKKFNLDGELISCERHGSGHINKTYLLVMESDKGVKTNYILQQVNDGIFKEVDDLMENVVNVTKYLRDVIVANGGDALRETINVIQTIDGKNYYHDETGYYRIYVFITDSVSYDAVESAELFKKSGIAFGKFQKLLSNYPAEQLNETIPDFHNTKKRFETFLNAVKNNLSGRAQNVQSEIEFVKARENDTYKLVDLIAQGKLPLRVTHNDTKLNNVMFDKNTNDCICVVDLDTVMPGLALYDFGDSIRFGANTALEDEKDLSKVSIDLDYFRAYTEGFLSECGESLTDEEIDNLAFSAKLMTFECGMRFLSDYLDGDVYFGVAYPEHNLVRARNQFKLVEDMEKHMDEMKQIVNECVGR